MYTYFPVNHNHNHSTANNKYLSFFANQTPTANICDSCLILPSPLILKILIANHPESSLDLGSNRDAGQLLSFGLAISSHGSPPMVHGFFGCAVSFCWTLHDCLAPTKIQSNGTNSATKTHIAINMSPVHFGKSSTTMGWI